MNPKTYKPATRTQLAKRYGVSSETMRKWLQDVPDLTIKTAIRVLTPKQVECIIQHLGEPPD